MKMNPGENPSHLDPRSVEEYFRLGVKTAFTLRADPVVVMEIDPARDEIELRTPAVGSEPDVTAFERLSVVRIQREGTEWFRLVVDARDMHYEAYVLLESIAEQMKSGASFRHAVSEAASSLKDLLAGPSRFTEEKILGLLGELMVLTHAIDALGEECAISAWLGPLAAEHDFAFAHFDAEVKTTKSESRVHVIGSETQLEPVRGRPLYLVSIQLTRAGLAEQGFTLQSVIADTRTRLDLTRRTFDAAIAGLGWRDKNADLYRVRYQSRSKPRAYLVDDEFPAITSARLDRVVPQRPHVASVTYRVDVTDLGYTAIGAPLDDFCEDSK